MVKNSRKKSIRKFKRRSLKRLSYKKRKTSCKRNSLKKRTYKKRSVCKKRLKGGSGDDYKLPDAPIEFMPAPDYKKYPILEAYSEPKTKFDQIELLCLYPKIYDPNDELSLKDKSDLHKLYNRLKNKDNQIFSVGDDRIFERIFRKFNPPSPYIRSGKPKTTIWTGQ
jgi:hypothetical protein